jgi:hypothetical protein
MLLPPYAIQLSEVEQQALEAWRRAGKTPPQTVRRAPLLLLAPEGLSHQASADTVGPARNVGQKGRKRLALYARSPLVADEEVEPAARLGALQELPRSGRPPDFSPAGPAYRRRRGLPRR